MEGNFLLNLKKELIVFFSILLVSISLLAASMYFFDQKKSDKQIAGRQLLNAKNRYRTAVENHKLLKANKDKYTELKNSGFVANENRLNWLSAIDGIVQKYEIPMVKYNVKKQNKIPDLALISMYPDIDIYQSEMMINMSLLHEGDLLKLLNQLSKKAKGEFDIYSCQLKRNYMDIDDVIKNKKSNNVSATCKMAWLTVKNKRA